MSTAVLLPTPIDLRQMIHAREEELRRLRALLRLSARADAVADLLEQHQAAHGVLVPSAPNAK